MDSSVPGSGRLAEGLSTDASKHDGPPDAEPAVEAQRLLAECTAQLAAAHAARQLAQEEVDRASLAKTEFLSSMSHQLRTPMNAILGFAQLLESTDRDSRDQESIQQILRAGSELLAMIDRVLEEADSDEGVQRDSGQSGGSLT